MFRHRFLGSEYYLILLEFILSRPNHFDFKSLNYNASQSLFFTTLKA